MKTERERNDRLAQQELEANVEQIKAFGLSGNEEALGLTLVGIKHQIEKTTNIITEYTTKLAECSTQQRPIIWGHLRKELLWEIEVMKYQITRGLEVIVKEGQDAND